MSENKVQLEIFEGPLDLLLYLVKKEEVDIYEVNLTRIATQFIEYVQLMKELDLDVAGEFLVMAATLMYIKSKELLPRDKQIELEEEEEEDPRWDLIRQLVEYKKFKDAAGRLQELEVRQEQVYARIPGKPEFALDAPLIKSQVSVFELISAVSNILRRYSAAHQASREVFEDQFTVSSKIEFVSDLLKQRNRIKFSELFESAASRTEVICTFLALLELIRLKQLHIEQPEPFAEIEITSALPQAPPVPLEHQAELGVTPTEATADNSAPRAATPEETQQPS
jgi:segregation and condensation protein A